MKPRTTENLVVAGLAAFILVAAYLVGAGYNPKPAPAVTPVAAPAPAPVPPQLVVHAIYKGDSATAGGSGVMIAPNIMLTAAHVARAAEGLTAGDQRAPLKFLSINEDTDLALALVAIQCPCASLRLRNPEPGTPVTVVGFPMNPYVGLQITTEGKWQGVRRVKLEDTDKLSESFAMMTAPVAPGNSGGGVFILEDGQWRLVGITVALIAVPMGYSASLIPHLAIASPASSILDLVRSPHKLPKKASE